MSFSDFEELYPLSNIDVSNRDTHVYETQKFRTAPPSKLSCLLQCSVSETMVVESG